MRMSCNGCRVLRKGCSDDCSIRPCLEWIKSPASQANATVFLAKFYGRAGLINLINAAPHHHRPATFRSMLYEASGRIVNPVYGSVGLMWSGNWQLCNDAVEAVLNGLPITQIATDETKSGPPLKASCDIRHVNNSTGSNDLNRVKNRCRFKRTGTKSKTGQDRVRSPSHESSLSHQSATAEATVDMESRLSESLGSAEIAEVEVEPNSDSGDGEIELDLTLGFEPIKRFVEPRELKPSEGVEPADEGRICKMELGL